MPKVPRAATTRVRVVPVIPPPGTPISRRLRSRAAPSLEDTIKSSIYNSTTDFDSDSEDFVRKKPKTKPKSKKVTTKGSKSKKTSLKNKSDTDIGESSTGESDARTNNKGPRNSKDLVSVSQSDANEKGEKKILKDKNIKSKSNDDTVRLEAKVSKPSSDNTEKIQVPEIPTVQSQSSSEEYKTPESTEKTKSVLVDLSNEDEIPDIVQEFSTGNIKFIAKNTELQQVEMKARRRLLEIRKKMDEYIRKFRLDSAMKTLELSKVFGNILLCDILEELNNPNTFDEVVTGLKKLEIPAMKKDKLAIISEDSEVDLDVNKESDTDTFKTSEELTPKSIKTKYSFPRPNNQQDPVTPPPGLHQLPTSVFHFGGGSTSSIMSANKLARLAKPGEVYYSARGSPIVPPALGKVPDSAFSQYARGPHTIEIADNDGEKIKVDLVLRSGAPEKIKFFAEFVTDVRGIAATRSTVKHNRIQPARVPTKNRKGASTSTAVSVPVRKRN